MKKSLTFLLTSILCLSIIFNMTFTVVFAENDNRTKTPESTKTEQKVDDSTKKAEVEAEKQPESSVNKTPEVVSEAAYLINPDTGTVLFEKNADKRMFPASTTKILTAYLAITNLDLDSQITVSDTAVDIDRDGSNMGLVSGEILTVRQLLDALIIRSANDAANALAEAVSGSVENFVQLMNDTATDMGLTNTHFENPHGYHHVNHFTTAHDMAIIAAKAMENEIFAEISSVRRIVIEPTNLQPEKRIYNSHNAMINPYSDVSVRYRYATGIKTGHTNAAGYCFVGSATKSGMNLISVVFKSDSYERSFMDTKNLFEFAHSKYRIRTVNKSDEIASTCKVRWAWGKDHLVLKTNKDLKALVPAVDFNEKLFKNEIIINDKVTAPVKEGEQVGVIKYYYDDELIAESGLFASRSVSKNIFKQIFSYLLSVWFLSGLGIVVIIIIVTKLKESKKSQYNSGKVKDFD